MYQLGFSDRLLTNNKNGYFLVIDTNTLFIACKIILSVDSYFVPCKKGKPNKQVNKRQRISKGQSKKDNPEKLATRQRQTKQKHNTICVGHHYTQTNTNNVNKT